MDFDPHKLSPGTVIAVCHFTYKHFAIVSDCCDKTNCLPKLISLSSRTGKVEEEPWENDFDFLPSDYEDDFNSLLYAPEPQILPEPKPVAYERSLRKRSTRSRIIQDDNFSTLEDEEPIKPRPNTAISINPRPIKPRPEIRTLPKKSDFMCQKCGRRYRNAAAFANHVKECVDGEEKSKDETCDLCLRRFENEKQLSKHLDWHRSNKSCDLDSPITCPKCHEELNSKFDLNPHFQSNHDPMRGLLFRLLCHL